MRFKFEKKNQTKHDKMEKILHHMHGVVSCHDITSKSIVALISTSQNILKYGTKSRQRQDKYEYKIMKIGLMNAFFGNQDDMCKGDKKNK